MSMKKKITVAVLLLSVWGGSMIFANTATSKVNVIFNGSELSEEGALIDGKTFLPLRQLANSFQALIEWDANKKAAVIHKPNVHMFVFQGKTSFGIVDRGSYKFNVFSQIDNLKTDIAAIKVSIFDSKGKERVIQTETVNQKNDNFWFVTEEIDYRFETSGKYTIKFFMKMSSNDDWTAVSEKVITSR